VKPWCWGIPQRSSSVLTSVIQINVGDARVCRCIRYGPHAYLWEVEELLRKLSLSALLVYFDQGSTIQVMCAVIICGWASLMHGVYKPFVDRGSYFLQHAALQIIFLVFVVGLAFKVSVGLHA